MAAWVSRAAASMFRFKSNCRVTLDPPRLLDEVISVTAAMRPNCRSSGVATEEAIVSGLAPGKFAPTETVGKSTWGSGDTGSMRKATTPASDTATTRRVVAIGRRIKGSEIFMLIQRKIETIDDFRFSPQSSIENRPSSIPRRRGGRAAITMPGKARRQTIKPKINDRSRVEGQQLA